MSAVHFSPWPTTQRPCWHCTSFRGLIYAGSAAKCGLPNSATVRSMPANGCSGFEREVGADDETDKVPACAALPGLPDRPAFVDRPAAVLWAP